jgi:hypothetical protein
VLHLGGGKLHTRQKSKSWHKDYPRLQILTVEDILAGKQPNIPHDYDQTFARAEKEDGVDHKDQINLF